jgi:Escherichia/Staphylococcus phage prohead protease
MQRAYSLLTVKRVSEDERVIEGLATSPEPDRMGDIVEPKGAQFKLPLPLLMHHDSRQPVGHVISAKVGNDGIAVVARIIKFDEPGSLKDRLDEAWHTVKSGLINGLSIGFRAIERSYNEETNGLHFLSWEWLELSLVSVPANSEASITTVRSLCEAASGQPAPSGAPEPKIIRPVMLRAPTRTHPITVTLPGQRTR